MIRYALPLIAAAALASPAVAADVQIQASGPVVQLSVSESVQAKPDTATVSAGVTTQAQSAVAAMQQNAQAMSAVVARIKSLGIAEDDIQTAGIGLSPRYDYDQKTQSQLFRGYTATNRVSVKLRQIDRTGKVLDALVAAGATDIGGPDFAVDDDAEYRAQARHNAFERARAQATDYARMAGYSGVRLLEIDESLSGNSPPVPFARAKIEAQDASTPVQPGLVGTTVNLTVTYELTR